MFPDPATSADGRDKAGRIARAAVARALREGVPAGMLPGSLAAALAFLCLPGGAGPRAVGLQALRLLRHATGEACAVFGPGPAGDAAFRALDALDAAVTALGGVPLLYRDLDDWGLPEEAGEVLLGHEIAPAAREAAHAARRALSAAEAAGPDAGLMHRDAAALTALCLALVASSAEAGAPPRRLVAAVSARSRATAGRLAEAAGAWPGLPGGAGIAAAARRAETSLRGIEATAMPAPSGLTPRP